MTPGADVGICLVLVNKNGAYSIGLARDYFTENQPPTLLPLNPPLTTFLELLHRAVKTVHPRAVEI